MMPIQLEVIVVALFALGGLAWGVIIVNSIRR